MKREFKMNWKFIKNLGKGAVCLCVSASMMCSCGIIAINRPAGNTDTESETEAETLYQVSEYEKYSANYSDQIVKFMFDVNDADYGGGSFLVATPKPATIYPDETEGAILSKAVAERNDYIKEQLNIDVTAKYVDPNLLYDEMRTAVRSESYYADLVMFPQAQLGAHAVAGNLVNLYSMPGLNLNGGYFDQTAVDAGGGASKVYALAGPASLNPDCLSGVYFNKDIITSLGLISPYDLVNSGNWTWEKYFEYVANANIANGVYSYGTQNTSLYLADLIYFSCGGRLVTVEEGPMPTVAIDLEWTQPVIQLANRVFIDPNRNPGNMTAIDDFAAGNTIFLIDELSTMEALANSAANWGVLPLPKYTADQAGYKTLAFYDDALFFGVVPTITDSDKTTNLLTILNIASYGEMGDAYAENSMCYYLRDNESAKMVDIIMDSAIYDLSYSYAINYDAIATATYTAIRNPATGYREVAYYVNGWTHSFNSAMYRLFG